MGFKTYLVLWSGISAMGDVKCLWERVVVLMSMRVLVPCLFFLWQQDKGSSSPLPFPELLHACPLCKRLRVCKARLHSRPPGVLVEENSGQWKGNGAGNGRPRFLTEACLASGEAPSGVKANGGSIPGFLLTPCPGLYRSVWGVIVRHLWSQAHEACMAAS